MRIIAAKIGTEAGARQGGRAIPSRKNAPAGRRAHTKPALARGEGGPWLPGGGRGREEESPPPGNSVSDADQAADFSFDTASAMRFEIGWKASLASLTDSSVVLAPCFTSESSADFDSSLCSWKNSVGVLTDE